MKKVTDIFEHKDRTFSFEFFPPKTDAGCGRLHEAADALAELGADFFSVTYGAGGSTSKSTLEIVRELQRRLSLPGVHHYTCVRHDYDDIRRALEEMRRAGVRNILAMRGDPPRERPNYRPGPNELRFGYQLVELIHQQHDGWFSVGVPAFPEGHVLTPTKDMDSKYVRVKQDAGAEFIITQLFFDNAVYREFRERIAGEGVTLRAIPGILPITDYRKLVEFCDVCGATVPPSLRDIFEPIQDDPAETARRGLEIVTRQCQDLLDTCGAPGLHFFCLNKTEPVSTIVKSLRL